MKSSMDRTGSAARSALLRRRFLRSAGAGLGIAAAAGLWNCSGGGENTGVVDSKGGQSIPLTIVRGPNGATLALVPVYVGSRGPYTFAIDTGASQTLMDKFIVEENGLKVTGKAEEVSGVVSSEQLELVDVRTWRVGDIELPAATVTAAHLPGSSSRHGLQGLLGSDILSRYGSFTLDYKTRTLTLF